MAIPKKIEFITELPPTNRGKYRRSHYDHIVKACLQNPGAWTVFNDGVSGSRCSDLRKQFPGFEFTARSIHNGTTKHQATIYGRFVGTQK